MGNLAELFKLKRKEKWQGNLTYDQVKLEVDEKYHDVLKHLMEEDNHTIDSILSFVNRDDIENYFWKKYPKDEILFSHRYRNQDTLQHELRRIFYDTISIHMICDPDKSHAFEIQELPERYYKDYIHVDEDWIEEAEYDTGRKFKDIDEFIHYLEYEQYDGYPIDEETYLNTLSEDEIFVRKVIPELKEFFGPGSTLILNGIKEEI